MEREINHQRLLSDFIICLFDSKIINYNQQQDIFSKVKNQLLRQFDSVSSQDWKRFLTIVADTISYVYIELRVNLRPIQNSTITAGDFFSPSHVFVTIDHNLKINVTLQGKDLLDHSLLENNSSESAQSSDLETVQSENSDLNRKFTTPAAKLLPISVEDSFQPRAKKRKHRKSAEFLEQALESALDITTPPTNIIESQLYNLIDEHIIKPPPDTLPRKLSKSHQNFFSKYLEPYVPLAEKEKMTEEFIAITQACNKKRIYIDKFASSYQKLADLQTNLEKQYRQAETALTSVIPVVERERTSYENISGIYRQLEDHTSHLVKFFNETMKDIRQCTHCPFHCINVLVQKFSKHKAPRTSRKK